MNTCSLEETAVVVKKAWEVIFQKTNLKGKDHFFLLGGDSLLASMFILSLIESMQIELSLGDVYDNPTLNELSIFVHKELSKTRVRIIL